MTDINEDKARLCFHILDNMTTAALLFDRNKRLLHINASAEVMLQVSARLLVGAHATEMMNCPGKQVETILDRALQAEQSITEREVRLPLIDKNITVNCTVTPVEDEHYGQQVLVELRQVDRHLRISREETLLSQHQASEALVRGLAHEIKNPLGGLRGAAQLLERELPSEDLTEYTQIIIAEADRLQSLVNRMLGPNQPLQLKPINLHVLLERVYQLVSAENQDSNIDLKRDYDPSIPDISVDSDQMIQVFLNIVRNAIQAINGKGSITLRSRIQRHFTIGNKRHRLAARIDIIDTGPGIPDDMSDTLFFPMVTGRAEGTGLGLPIAQSLVARHGGLIEFTSEPGHTEFTVILPLEAKS